MQVNCVPHFRVCVWETTTNTLILSVMISQYDRVACLIQFIHTTSLTPYYVYWCVCRHTVRHWYQYAKHWTRRHDRPDRHSWNCIGIPLSACLSRTYNYTQKAVMLHSHALLWCPVLHIIWCVGAGVTPCVELGYYVGRHHFSVCTVAWCFKVVVFVEFPSPTLLLNQTTECVALAFIFQVAGKWCRCESCGRGEYILILTCAASFALTHIIFAKNMDQQHNVAKRDIVLLIHILQCPF